MTRIDFYILDAGDAQSRYPFACRLADKAYQQGQRVHLHTPSAEQARRLDELLWTFRQDSFLPHALIDDTPLDAEAPVGIGFRETPWPDATILINLTHSVPSFFSQFDRVIEIVTQDEPTRLAARESFRFYRDRGYPLDSHDLRRPGR